MAALTSDHTPHRGRPRSEACRRAVLDAATALLDDVGLRRMTVDALAQRAGVSKATIYKWWPNKASVALDAFLEDTEAAIPVSDTGSATEDLRRQLRAAVKFYAGPKGKTYRHFVAEAQTDPDFAQEFIDRFLARRRQSVKAIWERGVARGEFRADVEPLIALDLIYGPMIFRLLVGQPTLTPSMVEAMLDAALGGLATVSERNRT